jgi:hypothetical protein
MGGRLVMPGFLARIFYALRGKRRVRYHLFNGQGNPGETLEGVELGCWAGHYVAILGHHVVNEGQSVPLEGHAIEIARERVMYRQVLCS